MRGSFWSQRRGLLPKTSVPSALPFSSSGRNSKTNSQHGGMTQEEQSTISLCNVAFCLGRKTAAESLLILTFCTTGMRQGRHWGAMMLKTTLFPL